MSKVIVKAMREVIASSKVVCDWCGAEANDGEEFPPVGTVHEYALECHSDAVQINISTSCSYYGEGGCMNGVSVDLCPTCAIKVVDWLRASGVKIRDENHDW